MGRPPKPTELMRLQGTLRPGRHGDRKRKPKPPPGAPLAPEWLLPEARAEWDRVVRGYGKEGILTGLDWGMLATYATMWARFVESEATVPYVGLPASYLSAMAGIATRAGGGSHRGAEPTGAAGRHPAPSLAAMDGSAIRVA
jgi:phage terminase small subunit